MIPTPRFPPPGPLRNRVPRVLRYYQDAVTPRRPSRFTSFPSFRDTTAAHGLHFAPDATVCVRCAEPGACSPGDSVPGSCTWRHQGLPSSRGAFLVRLLMFPRPRPDVWLRPFVKHTCCPRSFNYEGSDDSTIEAQLHGFRTRCLRFVVQVTRTPRKTRYRLLVRLCRTGLPPEKAPLKGFILNCP